MGEVWQGMLSPESSRDAALRADDTDGHGGDWTGVRQPPPRSASSAGGFNHPERQRLRASFTDTPVGSCAHAARPGSWSQVPTSPLQGEGRAAPRAAVSTAGAPLPRQMGTRQRARAARGYHLGKRRCQRRAHNCRVISSLRPRSEDFLLLPLSPDRHVPAQPLLLPLPSRPLPPQNKIERNHKTLACSVSGNPSFPGRNHSQGGGGRASGGPSRQRPRAGAPCRQPAFSAPRRLPCGRPAAWGAATRLGAVQLHPPPPVRSGMPPVASVSPSK